MRVAHHATYFVWFEMARTEFCRSRGIDYNLMEANGFFMPIVEARCRYKLPARYDDELTITATVVERTKRTMRTEYTVHRGETLLAEAETLQILIDSSRRPRSFPEELAARIDGPPNSRSENLR